MAERFLDSSTPHRGGLRPSTDQIVSSQDLDQRAWTSHLGRHDPCASFAVAAPVGDPAERHARSTPPACRRRPPRHGRGRALRAGRRTRPEGFEIPVRTLATPTIGRSMSVRMTRDARSGRASSWSVTDSPVRADPLPDEEGRVVQNRAVQFARRERPTRTTRPRSRMVSRARWANAATGSRKRRPEARSGFSWSSVAETATELRENPAADSAQILRRQPILTVRPNRWPPDSTTPRAGQWSRSTPRGPGNHSSSRSHRTSPLLASR